LFVLSEVNNILFLKTDMLAKTKEFIFQIWPCNLIVMLVIS